MARGMKVAAVFVAVLVAALADQVPSAAPIDGGAGIMSFDQHSPDVTEVASRIGQSSARETTACLHQEVCAPWHRTVATSSPHLLARGPMLVVCTT
jgi:hypothetical protein